MVDVNSPGSPGVFLPIHGTTIAMVALHHGMACRCTRMDDGLNVACFDGCVMCGTCGTGCHVVYVYLIGIFRQISGGFLKGFDSRFS